MMKMYRWFMLLLVAGILSACSNYEFESDSVTNQESTSSKELLLAIPSTRATIDSDLNLRWSQGDRITLMAYDGSTQIFQKEARFWANLIDKTANGYTQAYFKAKFDATLDASALAALETMANGICYAVSPVKGVTIDGNTATMTIPQVQTGEYSAAPDFMTARSNSFTSLKVCDGTSEDANDGYINQVGLTFVHHTHAFRVKIGQNYIGQRVKAAYLKFPVAVVGDVSVDFTTGAITEVKGTSDWVKVEFSEPKTAGDEFWVMIAPQEICGKVDIRFQVEDGGFTQRRIATFTQQNWSAGRISTINNMPIPAAVGYTYLNANITSYTQLGEPVTNLHLSLPKGYYFTDYNQTSISNPSSVNDPHTFAIFNDLVDNTLSTSNVTLSYESEHALVPTTTQLGGLNVGATNTYNLIAPWLFYEDFNSVVTHTGQYKETGGSMMDAGGLVGWSGSRWKSDGDRDILTLSCYVGTTAGNTDIQYGRADTPPLTNIKEGKTPKIKVVYDLGLEKHRYWELFEGGQCDIQAQLHYGTTEYNASNPITTGGSLAILGSLGEGQGYPQTQLGTLNSSNGLTTCDFTKVLNSDHGGTTYNSSKMNKNVSFTTSAISTTRITWFENYYHTSGSPAARTIHIYLDNVRISITQ